jgi:hypothetical protein
MDADHPLTLDHFFVFGSIIHSFAYHEHLIQATIAGIAKIDIGNVIILTAPLGYAQKRDCLYSLMEHQIGNENLKKQIKDYLDEIDKLNYLRNAIAHNMWVSGTRPNSIKPMGISVRGGKGKLKGVLESEQDYLLEELISLADKLALINNSYLEFVSTLGLLLNLDVKSNV